jgi:ABC-type Fe3+-siderophore transport system permease subunit
MYSESDELIIKALMFGWVFLLLFLLIIAKHFNSRRLFLSALIGGAGGAYGFICTIIAMGHVYWGPLSFFIAFSVSLLFASLIKRMQNAKKSYLMMVLIGVAIAGMLSILMYIIAPAVLGDFLLKITSE